MKEAVPDPFQILSQLDRTGSPLGGLLPDLATGYGGIAALASLDPLLRTLRARNPVRVGIRLYFLSPVIGAHVTSTVYYGSTGQGPEPFVYILALLYGSLAGHATAAAYALLDDQHATVMRTRVAGR